MKQHEISIKTLNADAVSWIEKLRQVLLIQDKGKGTVKNYTAEMMLHGGYRSHNGKNKRIAAIHLQLNLPKPMPKVTIPFSVQMLQRTGIDYSLCTKCKTGKMEIVARYLNHNGTLINIKDLNRSKTKNKSSPLQRPAS